MTAECPFGGAESSPLTPVWVPGWLDYVRTCQHRCEYPAGGGTQSRVSGDGSGLLQRDVESGPPPRQAVWADTSDVVSVNQIGKREEPTTNVCDAHT